jgi:transposase
MRFVKLSAEQQENLKKLYWESENHRKQQRAQAMLLSSRGYRMEQLDGLLVVDRDTISSWFNHWQNQQEKEEIRLQDAERNGRPLRLSEEEKKQ